MARKRDYVVRVNGGAKRGASHYQYNYASTKGIKLDLSPRSATINMSLWSRKSASEFGATGCRLYDDSLYKTSMAWLVRYGRIIPIQRVTVGVDDGPETVVYDAENLGGGSPPYSAFNYSGKVSLPEEFSSEHVMSTILSISRTKLSYRMASLNALLLAKMKSGRSSASDIVERFSTSWTALNGYYNFVAYRARPSARLSDRDKMGISLRFHGLGNCAVMQKHGAQFARVAIQAMDAASAPDGLATPDAELQLALLSAKIGAFTLGDGTKPYESLELYGYLLFCLPYYFRCQLLHGEKPLPLFVYETDERVWCLPLLSDLIVDFLDKNLWKLFDNSELDAIDQWAQGL